MSASFISERTERILIKVGIGCYTESYWSDLVLVCDAQNNVHFTLGSDILEEAKSVL
jgi:hypothetical protein